MGGRRKAIAILTDQNSKQRVQTYGADRGWRHKKQIRRPGFGHARKLLMVMTYARRAREGLGKGSGRTASALPDAKGGGQPLVTRT